MKDKLFGGETGVIPFLTLGYPNLQMSEELVYVLDQAGADLVMLGIPFSDPAGESPVLRLAGETALRNRLTTDHIFDLLARVRRRTDIPLALRCYANIVFAYGTQRFVEKAARLNVSALILPDVPFEEQAEFKDVCAKCGIQLISIVAPAPEDRIERIVRQAQGFIYLLGPVTEELVSTVRKFSALPIVASYLGATTPTGVDGIVLESEIVELVLEHGSRAPGVILDYVKDVIAATRSFPPEEAKRRA